MGPTDDDEPEFEDDMGVELDDECWDALAPEDDYEPLPEPGDFWTEQEAA